MSGLVAHDLRVYREGRLVVHGLSTCVTRGSCVVLLGANGAGKSTALRALAGLLPSEGRLTLDGRPHTRPNPRRIAVLFQDPGVAPGFTVSQVVALGGPHGAAALEVAGVKHLCERRFDQLSGGERQRVQLARCLAQGAELLLLDEPSNHLDAPGRALLRGLIRSRARGVLIATHDLSLAALADQVVLLSEGRPVFAGPPQDLPPLAPDPALDAGTLPPVYTESP